MDATYLNTFIVAFIDDLTPAPVLEDGADRRLCHLLESPRRIVDEPALLAVLAAAVTARNVFDHVIAQAVAAAERLGVPARRQLKSGTDLLTPLGMAPGAAQRAVRVGRAASTAPALTQQQRLDGRSCLAGSGRPTYGGGLPHVTLIRPGRRAEDSVDSLGFGGSVSAATADLIACDSTLTSMIVDHTGVPLDVGRSERLFTPAIRNALGVRDGGCAHPGCGRPVSWCDAHHIEPWSSGGITSLDNGVLLCRYHHGLIHHGGWQVYLGPDRHPWFIPPHDPAAPEPEPLRSHTRRTMTDLPAAA
ncbi:MAG: HNH endonuclease signature motif containing protein [Mycobacterium sp.]|nr:HNH endonuclease signature motif containing protein [Mycobacterium sp.]